LLIVSKVLWIVCLVAQGAVLARLITAGLVRRAFPLFSTCISWGILSGLILVWIPFTSASYGHAWLITEPLFILLRVAAVWECFRRAVAPYHPSDRYFVLAIAGTLSFTFSLFSMSLELHALSRVTALFWVILFGRMVAFGTALFLGGFWLIFRQFPIPTNANTRLHWRLLFFYGLQGSAAFMIDALSSGRLVNLGNVVGQTGSLVLYILWAWKLTAAGELDPIQPVLNPEDREPLDQERADGMTARESLRIAETFGPGARQPD
jgi:hypothetical protein